MESTFFTKEIVWAKVKGYPWWPAQIAKLPSSDNNVFKVVFIAEDTHAFLNPKDVRKFMQYYDECSKKKMRGLAPAIQAAQQVYKKRIQIITKTQPVVISEATSKPSKSRHRPSKKKTIKKSSNRVIREQKSQIQSEQSQSQEGSEGQPEKEVSQMHIQEPVQNESQSAEDAQNSGSQQQSQISEEKFMCESQEKIDRNKIQNFEESLLKIVEAVKDGGYSFSQADFKQLPTLLSEELLQSKILNILSFIASKMPAKSASETQDLRWLNKLREQLKQKTLEYLYDTSYYDQYLKLIQKNKKNRSEYEGKLTSYLKNQYRIKKELAAIFASRVVAEINNGTIVKEKQLLEDIRERKAEVTNINNKAAIQRCIQALIAKYN